MDPSYPLKVVVDIGAAVTGQQGVQQLAWLLVTLLTRSTGSVIEAIGVSCDEVPLLAGVDPAAVGGGPSLPGTLKATAAAFGPEAAPVIDAGELGGADLVLQIGDTAGRVWPGAEVLHVSATGWTGTVTPDATQAPALGADAENPFGPYVAACLAAGQVYMYARVRDQRLQPLALNAWALTQSTCDLRAVAAADPGEPTVKLEHMLAGAGAVGSALLLTLWAYRPVSGTIKAADNDPEGVDVTNLNRCVPFHCVDLGDPKAIAAARRLSGHHDLVIEPIDGSAEDLVGPGTHLISAVDTPDARQALQDRYPASAVQASTFGLRLEMLRVDPTAGTACLRCFNPPRGQTPDSQIRAQVADMDEATLTAHAEAIDADANQVREWAQTGGCGRVGDALLDRLRPSDGNAAQFSVGFISVLAGVLLAGQVLKDAALRAGHISGGIPMVGENARFVTNLLDPRNALAGVCRYSRDSGCPACKGVRADVWAKRWTG